AAAGVQPSRGRQDPHRIHAGGMTRPPPARRRLLAPGALAARGACLALAMSVGEARGDLSTDAARLQASWEARGARVVRLAPVFLEHGRPRAVSLPASAYDAAGTGCTTIAFLAGRSIDF